MEFSIQPLTDVFFSQKCEIKMSNFRLDGMPVVDLVMVRFLKCRRQAVQFSWRWVFSLQMDDGPIVLRSRPTSVAESLRPA